MHFEATWHASGLRWIGSLFNGAAEFLERREAAVLAPRTWRQPAPEKHLEDARQRMLSRIF